MLILSWVATRKCVIRRRDIVEWKEIEDFQLGLTDLLSNAGLSELVAGKSPGMSLGEHFTDEGCRAH